MLVGVALLVGCLALVLVGALFWYTRRLHDSSRRGVELIERLHDGLQDVLHGHQSLAQSLLHYQTHHQDLVTRLHQELGQVTGQLQRLDHLDRQLQTLQQVLQNPQRGRLVGEASLEAILWDALPQPYFQLQYSFRNGSRVDAVVRIGDKLLPIDAKFPLESFQRLLQATTDAERQRCAREFRQAVLHHAESIQQKYIRPDEGTLDFALMFVPSESLYYEIIASADGGELLRAIQQKRVFPVSPNTLMGYIHIVVQGIRGLSLERRARQIIGLLETLDRSLQEVAREYATLSRHLRDAYRKSQDVADRLEDLTSCLDRLRRLHAEADEDTGGEGQ